MLSAFLQSSRSRAPLSPRRCRRAPGRVSTQGCWAGAEPRSLPRALGPRPGALAQPRGGRVWGQLAVTRGWPCVTPGLTPPSSSSSSPGRGGAGCRRLPRDTASPRPGPGGGGGQGCTCRHGSARLSTARHSSAQPCRQPRRRARRCRGALRPAGTAAAPPAATQVGRDAAGPSFRARGGTPGRGLGSPVPPPRLRDPRRGAAAAPGVGSPRPPPPRGTPRALGAPRGAARPPPCSQGARSWAGAGRLAGLGARSAEHGPEGAARHGACCRQLPAPGTASGGRRPGEKMEPRVLRCNGAMHRGLRWEMNQSSLASSSPPSTPVSLLNLGRGARFQSSLAGLGAVNLLPTGLWP